MNSPVNFNDPTGHMCSDPEDPNPTCDGSGGYPPNFPQPNPAPGNGGGSGEGSNSDEDEDGFDVGSLAGTALSIGATILDILSLSISMSGTILEGVGCALGEAFTPAPLIDGAIGCSAAVGLYNLYLNPLENLLSWDALLMVSLADVVSGQTHFELTTSPYSHQESTELILGRDTTFGLISIGFGNTFLTPEATSDTLANVATVAYDLTSLAGNTPGWASIQYHIGHENGTNTWDPLSWYDFASIGR